MDQTSFRNRLLRLMAADDFAMLAPHLEHVTFSRGQILMQPGDAFDFAFFFENGLGSIVTVSPDGLEAESGIFGRDGFAPVSLVMGDDRSPHRILVQVADGAYRLHASVLRKAAETSGTLRNLLLRYVQVLSVQTAFTALSNAVHPIDERLARWLLMCHDRGDGNELPITHEFLSIMLAVRRPSVTTALHVLEGNRFITAERGLITIRDRPGLQDFAGDAYGRPEAEYTRLIGPL